MLRIYSVEEESGFFPGFQEVELKVKDIGNRFSSVLKLVFRTKVSPERKKVFVEQIIVSHFPSELCFMLEGKEHCWTQKNLFIVFASPETSVSLVYFPENKKQKKGKVFFTTFFFDTFSPWSSLKSLIKNNFVSCTQLWKFVDLASFVFLL